MAERGLVSGEDGVVRCWWCGDDGLYQRYHDQEWGQPVADDRRLFEKICLEGFQAGLSWLTILRKREAFRKGFAGFDPVRVSRFGAKEIGQLLGDPGIVRHRGKIESAINNAQRVLEVQAELGSLAALLWRFEPARMRKRHTRAALIARAETEESRALGKELKRRGFSFVGATTMYAMMQSVGIVNDHLDGCASRPGAEAARTRFARPFTALSI